MKTWQFSLWLLIGYIAIFQLWLGADRSFIVASGSLWCLAYGVWILVLQRREYFLNRLDYFAHWVVILDVLLEALLLEEHNHLGFWLCALAFAAVIGGYRWKVMKRSL